MAAEWTWIAAEPRPDGREAILSLVEAHDWLEYDTDQDSAVVCSGPRSGVLLEEFQDSIADHAARMVKIWTVNEAEHIVGTYYERKRGDLTEVRVTSGTSGAAVVDFLTREEGIDGPF